VGAWVSQDLVRKANRNQTDIEHHMHGNPDLGYEVMPSNVAYTAEHLKLTYIEWDYTQPKPQSPAFKRWLKQMLVQGFPIVWFPICKGDSHECYPGSCPNGGHCDHVEPIFGIFSNYSLDDPTVYPDDVIVHASDQDYEPYYRAMSTLEDTLLMEGNCLDAQPGFGKNEMYPCFDDQVTYGLAVTGMKVNGSLPVSLSVDIVAEPNVRYFQKAIPVHGTVTVSGLNAGSSYTLFRYDSTDSVPATPPFDTTAQHITNFVASADTWLYKDPISWMSNTAVYYLAAVK
jgi:hypothetical protein